MLQEFTGPNENQDMNRLTKGFTENWPELTNVIELGVFIFYQFALSKLQANTWYLL